MLTSYENTSDDIGAHVNIIKSSFPTSSCLKSQGNNDIKTKSKQISTQSPKKKKEDTKTLKEKEISNQKPKTNDYAPFRCKLVQWNCRSINKQTKIDYIKGLDGEIIALQEIWNNKDLIKTSLQTSFQTLDVVTRTIKRGGGTATLINNFHESQIQKTFPINKDTNLIKLNFKNSYIWLANVYIWQGTIPKLQKIFGKIRKHIPQTELSQLIIIGDFNINANAKDDETFILLQKLCKQIFSLIGAFRDFFGFYEESK